MTQNIQVEEKPLLELVETIKVPAVKKFVASEKFIVGKTIDGVRISYIGGDFNEIFLDKIEQHIPEVELRVRRQTRTFSRENPTGGIPGIKKICVDLATFWEFLKVKSENYETGKFTFWIPPCNNCEKILWKVEVINAFGDSWSIGSCFPKSNEYYGKWGLETFVFSD